MKIHRAQYFAHNKYWANTGAFSSRGLSVKFFQSPRSKLVTLLYSNCVRLCFCTLAPGNMSFVLLVLCWEMYKSRYHVKNHKLFPDCLSVFHIVMALFSHFALSGSYVSLPFYQSWARQHAAAQPGKILRLCLFRHQELQHPQLWSKSSETVISSLLCCIRQLPLPSFLSNDDCVCKILCRCLPYECCDAKTTQEFSWFVRWKW